MLLSSGLGLNRPVYCLVVVFLGVPTVSLYVYGNTPGDTYYRDGQFVAKYTPGTDHDVKRTATDVKRAKRSDDASPLAAVVEAQAAVIQTLQAEMTALKADVDALKQTAAKSVAFSVGFHNDPINNVGVKGTLKFDYVVFNQGGSYNSQTGIFTSPASGLYVFFVGLMSSNSGNSFDVAIVKSGQVLDVAWAEGQSDAYDQGSCLSTTHLATGDMVWVQQWDGDSTSFRGGMYTTFSGFLLHADP